MDGRFLKFSTEVDSKDLISGTVKGIAYSGDTLRDEFWGSIVFDIASMKSREKVPFLLNHEPDEIVGYGELIKGQSLDVSGRLVSTSYADDVKRLSSEGFPWQMSVFIDPEYVEELQSGVRSQVNGREVIGPAIIFRNGLIREVSFTPTGVDYNTDAQAFSFSQSIKDELTKKLGAKKMGCECKNKEQSTNSDEVDTLKAEIESLKAEVQSYKDKEAQLKASAEKAAFEAKLTELKTEFSIESDDEAKEVARMSEKQLEMYRKAFSASKKETNKELTNSDLDKSKQKFSIDKNDPLSIQAAAEAYRKANPGASIEESINQVLK